MPLISVVMPVRNAGAVLAGAVASILQQSVTDLELIIIDDHSSDDAIDRINADDLRLRVVRCAGRGIVDALNTGLRLAKGQWIARMDGDDIALPRRFAQQLALGKAMNNAAIIGAKVEIFRTDGAIDGGYQRYESWINSLATPADIRREIYIESPIPHPTAFMHRCLVERIGPYRNGDFPEDYEFFLRAHAMGVPMAKPDAILLRWRDDAHRTSRTDSRYAKARFTRIKAAALATDPRCAHGVCIWGAGRSGKQLHDALAAQHVETHAFIDVHPRRTGNQVRNKPVLALSALADVAPMILIAVGTPGVRQEIRDALRAVGKVEERDFLFAM